jgi:hypothetical protein
MPRSTSFPRRAKLPSAASLPVALCLSQCRRPLRRAGLFERSVLIDRALSPSPLLKNDRRLRPSAILPPGKP